MTQENSSLIHLPQLIRFLRDTLSPEKGDIGNISIERHEAGYSNETFFVSWGEQRWVLRRPPSGDLLPTAHDMLREYRVLSALSSMDVRTPQPVIACEDKDVLGVPFYLMQRAEGLVVRDPLPPFLPGRQ
jgi:aminoglycoside phosphotransferase (APT) family kinase protein